MKLHLVILGQTENDHYISKLLHQLKEEKVRREKAQVQVCC